MAITIPSTEFVGLLADVAPFALDDEDFPQLSCVHVAWDGEMLHAQAHDGMHLAWSRWSDDDAPDQPAKESFLAPWGGADDPWSTTITLADAKLLIKTYKVGDKLAYIPVQVEEVDGNLRVTRDRAYRLMAIRSTVDGLDVEFADLDGVLAALPQATPVCDIAFPAAHLAHFAEVRQRGEMRITFTGERTGAVVHIGSRFTGAISPVRVGGERGGEGSNLLRDGSGVLLGTAA